ncbi:hypothetical protein [Oryza sativa Japonica Group]|uniref:Uncharacterized protein n=1 Tax=Oryza sativa subsp. japonica TaxID=39947 RepID=Q5VNQ1_ORYSJ|nr:hypothetical protein [Oryza sativa Japonica Group]BAD68924.1 hypothetical protein [Oryza sativa Japonica Group]
MAYPRGGPGGPRTTQKIASPKPIYGTLVNGDGGVVDDKGEAHACMVAAADGKGASTLEFACCRLNMKEDGHRANKMKIAFQSPSSLVVAEEQSS